MGTHLLQESISHTFLVRTDHSEEFANKDGDGDGQSIAEESASSCFSK